MATGFKTGLPTRRPQGWGLSEPADASAPANGTGTLQLPQRRPAPRQTAGLLPLARPNFQSDVHGSRQLMPLPGPSPTDPMSGEAPLPNHTPGQIHPQLLRNQSGPPRTLLPDSELPPPGPVHPLRTPAHDAYDAARDQRMQQGDAYSSGLQTAQSAPYQRNMRTYNSMGQPNPQLTDVRSRADAAIAGGLIGPRPATLTPSQSTMVAARGGDYGPDPRYPYAPDTAAPAPKPIALDGTTGGSGPNGERLTMGGPLAWTELVKREGSDTFDELQRTPGARSMPQYTEGVTYKAANRTPVAITYDPNQGNLQFRGTPANPAAASGVTGFLRDPSTGQLVRDPALALADSKAAARQQSARDSRILQLPSRRPGFLNDPRYQDAHARMTAAHSTGRQALQKQKMLEDRERQKHELGMAVQQKINDLQLERLGRDYGSQWTDAGRQGVIDRAIQQDADGTPAVPFQLPAKRPPKVRSWWNSLVDNWAAGMP